MQQKPLCNLEKKIKKINFGLKKTQLFLYKWQYFLQLSMIKINIEVQLFIK